MAPHTSPSERPLTDDSEVTDVPAIYQARQEHISDHDLERYHLGMIDQEAELAPFEEHLLACPECSQRAEETAGWVDTIRAVIIEGRFDLDG